MEQTLQLLFRNEGGTLFNVSLPNPKEGLTPTEASDAMDLVVEKNIFHSSGGSLATKVSARLVAREVTELVSFS